MSREASDGGASSKPKKSLNPFKRLFGKSSAPSLTRGYITPYGAGSSDAAGDLQLIRDYHNLYKHKLELHLEGRNQFIILFDLHDLLLDVVYVSTHGLRIVRKSKDLVEITGPEINETIKLPSIRTSKLITAPPKHFEELMNATTGAATPESPLKHNGNIPVGDEVCEDDQNEDDENTAEEPTTEELKVEEPKVEKAKVEEPKVEKAKVEEAEVEQPEVEEAKVEVPNVEVTKVEVTKVEEPKVEEAKVEQPKVEEPKVEETKVEETKVEEAKVEQPKIEEPKVDETKVEEPKVEELRVEELKVEETKVEETKVEQPKVEEAKVEEAKVEEPKVEEIKDEETKIEEPKVDEIKVEEIKVEETKIEEPKVDETKVEKAKVEKAKVEETRVEEAKVEQPIIEEPIIEEPKIEEPKIEEPKIEEPKIEETKVEETKVEVQTEEDLLAKVKDVQHLDVLTRGRPRANTRRLPTRRGFDIKIDSFDDLAIPEKDDFVVKQPATPTRGPGFGMPMGGFQLPPVGGVKLRSSVGDGESADPAPRPNPNRMTIAAGAPIGMVPMFNPAEAKLRKVGAVPKEESTESAGETKQIDFRDVLKKKKAAES